MDLKKYEKMEFWILFFRERAKIHMHNAYEEDKNAPFDRNESTDEKNEFENRDLQIRNIGKWNADKESFMKCSPCPSTVKVAVQ